MSCIGAKKYRCIDGSCQTSHFYCKSYDRQCSGVQDYYCGTNNGDNCVSADVYCMRPCGTVNENYAYNYRCPGFSDSCSWLSINCPEKCDYGYVKCPNSKRCESTLEHCKPCFEFRCRHSGLCISKVRHCDGKYDCNDASDETNCNIEPAPVPGDSASGDSAPILVATCVGFGIFVVVLVFIICCIRKRRRNQNRGRQGAVLSRNEPARPPVRVTGAPPSTNIPLLAGAGASPYASNLGPRPPGSQPMGYPMPPTAPGEFNMNSMMAAPPPSYEEVLDNHGRFKKVDTELPSYAESANIPPVNPYYSNA